MVQAARPGGAQVVLNQTRVYFYSDPAQCQAFLTNVPNGWRKLGFNNSIEVYPDKYETALSGLHSFRRPITDSVINETGAAPPLRARGHLSFAMLRLLI